jgi:hypothetical protein
MTLRTVDPCLSKKLILQIGLTKQNALRFFFAAGMIIWQREGKWWSGKVLASEHSLIFLPLSYHSYLNVIIVPNSSLYPPDLEVILKFKKNVGLELYRQILTSPLSGNYVLNTIP